jgi:hypothetical protein
MKPLFCSILALILLGFGTGSSSFGEDQIYPPFKNEHWNGHFGAVKFPPRSTPMWTTIGSAFAFGSRKDVVTCAHVVAGAYSKGETNSLESHLLRH